MIPSSVKLVFAGPVGAGKTTAIRSLSDMAPVSTEMPLSAGGRGEKTTTTVALDFSPVLLEDGTPLHIYGLPGQEHFSHMRPIVLKGALGAIVVLPADHPELASMCEDWIRSIRAIAPDCALVLGITHTDMTPDFRLDQVREAVRRCGPPIPAFTFDARDRQQTLQLVRALLVMIA